MSTSETQLRASAKLPPVERKVQVKPVVGEKSLTTNRRSCERSCIGAPPHCCMVDRVSDSNFAHRTKSNPLIAIVHLEPPVRCSLRRWHSSSLSLWQFSPPRHVWRPATKTCLAPMMQEELKKGLSSAKEVHEQIILKSTSGCGRFTETQWIRFGRFIALTATLFAGLTFAGLNFCWIHLLLVNSSPWHTPGLVAMCVDSLRSS